MKAGENTVGNTLPGGRGRSWEKGARLEVLAAPPASRADPCCQGLLGRLPSDAPASTAALEEPR